MVVSRFDVTTGAILDERDHELRGSGPPDGSPASSRRTRTRSFGVGPLGPLGSLALVGAGDWTLDVRFGNSWS
jgi:hypothetical protein